MPWWRTWPPQVMFVSCPSILQLEMWHPRSHIWLRFRLPVEQGWAQPCVCCVLQKVLLPPTSGVPGCSHGKMWYHMSSISAVISCWPPPYRERAWIWWPSRAKHASFSWDWVCKEGRRQTVLRAGEIMQKHLSNLRVTISYSAAHKHLQPVGIFYVKGFVTEKAGFTKLKDAVQKHHFQSLGLFFHREGF